MHPVAHEQGPAAVLWDMDGTLVDTEPYWIESEFDLAARHGGTWSRHHALTIVGRDLLDAGHYIRQHMAIEVTPEQIVEELLDGVIARIKVQIPWRPGARELLQQLRAAGVRCALVTMSYRRFVEPILDQLESGAFDAVVTGDMLDRGKPHPEPYLTAAAALGVAADRCLAIEDSPTGVTSAVAAGCAVLVVPNHVAVDAGTRRLFRESLTDVTVSDLNAIYAAASCSTTTAVP